MAALSSVVAQVRRTGLFEVREACSTKWEDIAGLEDVKLCMRKAVEWPILHRDTFERFSLNAPSGILLYGPPGCAKTTIVRVRCSDCACTRATELTIVQAVATSAKTAFVALNGAEVYSPFLGAAEECIRKCFAKARWHVLQCPFHLRLNTHV